MALLSDDQPSWEGYPFQSRYLEVGGSRLHYIDEGQSDGPVFLFLHGNPTSSYLWRNIVPVIAGKARAVAVDNIGFGRSDKPDIGYTFAEHAAYLEGFVEALALSDIILVIHDWGSALGLDYARRHPENVSGIVFMEAIVAPAMPATWETMAPPLREFFTALRTPDLGEQMVIENNFFIEETLFKTGINRELTEGEKAAYRSPFLNKEARFPILVWPRQIPISGEPADVVDRVNAYNDWLRTSAVPKLHLYVEPGALNPPSVAQEIARTVPALTSVFVGNGQHFMQEDVPNEIAGAIVEWYAATFPAFVP